jgi:hypothetical protein
MQNHAVIQHNAILDPFGRSLLSSTLSKSALPSPSSTITTTTSSTVNTHSHGQQPTLQAGNLGPASVVININAGSTGKGILIGILSAFGSAGIAVLVLAIFFFFRYTNRGRIILDRIGRPGEYDDEQAFAREEADALETMDELQRTEYLRAKGMLLYRQVLHRANGGSFRASKPTRDSDDRYLTFSVSCHSRKGSFSLGIRT